MKISNIVKEVSDSTEKIESITETITSITEQTNLLALNATNETYTKYVSNLKSLAGKLNSEIEKFKL